MIKIINKRQGLASNLINTSNYYNDELECFKKMA